jgi:hypothetical protein
MQQEQQKLLAEDGSAQLIKPETMIVAVPLQPDEADSVCGSNNESEDLGSVSVSLQKAGQIYKF